MKQKRKTRLPANWRDRIEILQQDTRYGETEFVLIFKKGRTPRGFGRHIGILTVDNDPPHYICECQIRSHFCRRRLGTLLYVRALTQFKSLTTDFHSASPNAQALWKSLIRKYRYKTDFFKGELTIWSP